MESVFVAVMVAVLAGGVANLYYQRRRRASRQGILYLRHYRKYHTQPKGPNP